MPIDLDLLTLSDTPVEAINAVVTENPTWSGTFSLASTSNLNVVLTEIDEGADADLRVYQDINNNEEFDSSIDLLIGSSARASNSDDSINLESVAAGNYIVEAYLYSGDGTDIILSLSTADPSNLLPTEVEVGTLNGIQTFTDFVGSTDTADVYRFSVVDTAIDFSLSLSDLSADADVRLILDDGGDEVDSGEVIASSTFGGTTSDEISALLNPGNYFVQVYQYSGDTNYTLSLTA